MRKLKIGEVSYDYIKPKFLENQTDNIYHGLLVDILKNGKLRQNRTGEPAYSVFGRQLRFKNVGDVFPILTTKRVHLKSVIGELLWFLSGNTNKFVLKEKYGCTIWDEWGDDETGEMGPIYGYQWRNFNSSGIDQMTNVLNTLKTDPDNRRMIVTAWNPEQLSQQALPPCHWSFQFNTNKIEGQEKRTLDLMMNIRSNDIFLGAPFNIASYGLLLLMVAQQVDMIPGDLIINIGDAHIYKNHIPFVIEQLKRSSKFIEIDVMGEISGVSPQIKVNKALTLFDYTMDSFELNNYNPYPNFKNVPIAI
jgi:thymidylate synthase